MTTSAPDGAAQSSFSADALLQTVSDFVTGVATLDPEQAAIRGGLTLLVLIGAMLVLTVVRLLFKATVAKVAPTEEDAKTAKRKHRRVGRSTLALARIAVWIGALILLLGVWGVDLAEIMEGPAGAILLTIGRLALVVILAIAAIEAIDFAIHQLFTRLAGRSAQPRRAAQIRTLAPVISGLARTVLVIVAAMMLLSEVGVEVGPLLAGAGIVGLAVGFGAQTLVKDFLTGVFLIIEDVVSVGDVARIGDSGGLVEEMTIRTIKLRDFDGTLHVFPYSEAQVIHNLTKSFSYYVFDLSVSYSADIAKALDLMKQVGDEMQADPEFRDFILEPIEVVGVDSLGASGVNLKARIKTQPIKQWTVGREYLKRIKLAFDAAGIEIPFPHLKLVPPDTPIPLGAALESAEGDGHDRTG